MENKFYFDNLIVAHRGIFDNKDIPENSLPAFKRALDYGYAIELDIQKTKDDVLVVFHDDNLKRMTRLNKRISDLTYNEIKSLNLLNTNYKIPTLEMVLKLVDGKVLLNIEIKKTTKYKSVAQSLMNILNKYNGNFVIQSFDFRFILYLKKKYPDIVRGLLISDGKNKLYQFINRKFIIKLCQIDFISVSKSLLLKEDYLIKKYPIFVWTIKNGDELLDYKDNNRGYICDNLPYKK